MLCGKDVARFNEPALSSVLADVKFIEDEIRRLERPALDRVLEEVKLVRRILLILAADKLTPEQTINLVLSDAIPGYLEASIRQTSYTAVKPLRLSTVLTKLARGTSAVPSSGAMSRAERRRMEADQVARLANASQHHR